MEEAAFLLPMHPVIRAVKIQNQFWGCLLKGGDELINHDFLHQPGHLTVGPVLPPAECGAAGQGFVPFGRTLPSQILSQMVVIVQILITQAQTIDALTNESQQRMHDTLRVARIRQYARQRLG